MRLHSYVIEHDYGFAPNPFWGTCTLACCKPFIRKVAQVGEWIVGTGSVADRNAGRLVYWMKITQIMSFNDYWISPKYVHKRAIINGSKSQQFGDNIYHLDERSNVVQSDSFHSEEDGSLSNDNRNRDTGITNRVLVGSEFAYFGKAAPHIPNELAFVNKRGPGHKSNFSCEQVLQVVGWLQSMEQRGFVEEPTRW